jgi:1-acyl-sn-glycerol-3-phosphate acyltransferase
MIDDTANVPQISKPILLFFRLIVRGHFWWQFRAVRLSRASHLASFHEERLIIYGNHSSWWDPMVMVLLGAKLMRKRRHYAPIDAEALRRYRILKFLGLFGVEMKSARGASRFMRTGHAILERGGVLWVTPQARFADVRERPLAFKPGLAALAAKTGDRCTLLPLAVEYVFWNERLPEALLRFGKPVRVEGQSSEALQQQLEEALIATMEALKLEAMARDPEAFSVLHREERG